MPTASVSNGFAAFGLRTTPGRHLPEEVKRNMIGGSCRKRMAEPEEIAKAMAFLFRPDADFIGGQVLRLDGGFNLKQTRVSHDFS